MAYTAIAEQAVAGPYYAEGGAAELTTVTFTAADATNSNQIVMSKKRVLLLFTNGGASPATVTVLSSADAYGRKGNITTFSIAAGAYAARFFEAPGWEQTLGGKNLVITPSATDIEVLAIPI